MYVYMNCLNIFWVNDRGGKAGARVGVGLKSRLEKPGIAEPDLLRALSPYAVVSLRVKSLSGSLGAAELLARFF